MKRPLESKRMYVVGGNEGHVQGLGLVLQMFEAARGAGGGGLKGFVLIIGLSAHPFLALRLPSTRPVRRVTWSRC